MEFSFNANLTHRAAIAVVAPLWNQADIIVEIENLIFSDNNICEHWKSIEFKVHSSLKKLELPNELKLKLENLLQPMGRQIGKWISHTRVSCQAYPPFSKSIMFVWTETGTLNYVTTTRLIIDCCSDNRLRFHLACIFFIEDIILKLWPDVRDTLWKRVNTNPNKVMSVIYWVHFLKGDMENMLYGDKKPISVFAFNTQFHERCVTSMNYCLLQTEPEKRQRLVFLAVERLLNARPHDGNVLLFLFSHLKKRDVSEIINERAYAVLASLLDWPCTEYFMAVVNSSWNDISNSDYLNLFQDIMEQVAEYNIGDIYKNLAKQFWKFAPLSIKKYAIQKCISGTFLSRLFQHENTDDIIQMILNDCNPSERQQIIFYFESLQICDFLVGKERWNSLKLFVKSCISSPSYLDEFMELYANYQFCDDEGRVLRTAAFFKNIKEWYNIVVY